MTTSPQRPLPSAFLFKYSFPVMYNATATAPFYGKQTAEKSTNVKTVAATSVARETAATRPVAGKTRSTAAGAGTGSKVGRSDEMMNGWNLSQLTAIPFVNELDGAQPFADLFAVWNERGLGFRLVVRNKRRKPSTVGNHLLGDGLHICIDTRNMQTVHRATRFCVQWSLLAAGGPRNGPFAVHQPINRAKEEPRIDDNDAPRLLLETLGDGYCLDAWLPPGALPGFDPSASPKLGFSCLVADSEHGQQYLVLDGDFPVSVDPSLWCTLDLQRGE